MVSKLSQNQEGDYSSLTWLAVVAVNPILNFFLVVRMSECPGRFVSQCDMDEYLGAG